jgi:hypothetical protein
VHEWENEPDRREWESHGLKCLILRGPMGALCGYVGVTPDNPAYQVNYWNDNTAVGNMVRNIDVHGGLTYSDLGDGDYRPAGLWWFGFDCSHSGDISPGMLEHRLTMLGYEQYRNFSYVTQHTEALAKQLAHIAEIVTTTDRMTPDELRERVYELEARLDA